MKANINYDLFLQYYRQPNPPPSNEFEIAYMSLESHREHTHIPRFVLEPMGRDYANFVLITYTKYNEHYALPNWNRCDKGGRLRGNFNNIGIERIIEFTQGGIPVSDYSLEGCFIERIERLVMLRRDEQGNGYQMSLPAFKGKIHLRL